MNSWRQPDSQQNQHPSPGQPDAKHETAILIELRCAGCVGGGGDEACTAHNGQNGNGLWLVCVPLRPPASCRQSLPNERPSRSAGDVTDEERISTCGVSGSGNGSVRHGAQAIQPVRNRSWAQTSFAATASKRYRKLVLQTRHTCFRKKKEFRNRHYGSGTVLARFWHCARD